ncbi:protein of unknown function (DUF3842) [Thermodesulfobium acidiphilum]|uniref:DUF3842 family protein n=1 Tax=Thermodesulfobium acidiphilum TaxID=1794699 RepID=A0A2R4W080_THEAF|nr:DUF3842 family protein [Thermodesulfobium acidiphilum]AWB10078.1 protein of unknown function (DUF3842) [Thermodesulfobium acidiphilum]
MEKNIIKIAIVDGQGGGIGQQIVLKIREILSEIIENIEIIALGTNAFATVNMLKAKANKGASGENAIIKNVPEADYILGSISILVADSMMGEFTQKMSEAVAKSKAVKILLPINQSNIDIALTQQEPLPHQVEDAVLRLKNYIERTS